MIQTRPKLVLMAGFGGSGKTTLAHTLATHLQWPVLDKDILKTRITYTAVMPPEDISEMAYDLLFALARDILIQQRLSVILDTSAAFRPVIDRANELVALADIQMKILLCKASMSVRYTRLLQRNKRDEGRRQLMSNVALIDEDNWHHFNHLPLEHLIELDTSQSLEAYLPKALCYLHDDRPHLCPLPPTDRSLKRIEA